MNIEFRVLSGGSAGAVITLARPEIVVGRHPEADLRFGPDTDLEVSARHALIIHAGGGWLVRDLASRNGTYVNGRRVTGDTPLNDGDRITFGGGGPEVEVCVAAPAAAAPPTVSRAIPGHGAGPGTPRARGDASSPATPAGSGTPTASAEPASTTGRIRAAVAHRTRRLRRALAAAVLILVAVVAAFLYIRNAEHASWERERADLRARIDSVLAAGEAAVRSLEGELEELAAALRDSQDRIRRLSDDLTRAQDRGDEAEIESLRARLQAATVALERQQLAAGLDFRAIERANRPAVARIYVEAADGTVSTATAFSVRPDATLVTSRHVVFGADGTERPRRIGIQFSDSDQVWPARILRVSPSADLAIVKVDNILGSVPTIRGWNARPDTIAPGTPVASVGFPLGGAPRVPGRTAQRLARPLVSAGVMLEVSAQRLEVQGYGAAGASGSPIFDADGDVLGVLFGGREDDAGHVVVAVPASVALRLLEALP